MRPMPTTCRMTLPKRRRKTVTCMQLKTQQSILHWLNLGGRWYWTCDGIYASNRTIVCASGNALRNTFHSQRVRTPRLHAIAVPLLDHVACNSVESSNHKPQILSRFCLLSLLEGRRHVALFLLCVHGAVWHRGMKDRIRIRAWLEPMRKQTWCPRVRATLSSVLQGCLRVRALLQWYSSTSLSSRFARDEDENENSASNASLRFWNRGFFVDTSFWRESEKKNRISSLFCADASVSRMDRVSLASY